MTKGNALSLIPTHIKALFRKKPLVAGEKAESYDALSLAVATAMHPKDIIDWFYVRDFVDLTWEVRRIRRFLPWIIHNGTVDVITRLLQRDTNDFVNFSKAKKNEIPMRQHYLYASKFREGVSSRLERYGFDGANYLAQSFRGSPSTIEITDRILTTAEIRRDKILREIERRCEATANGLREIIDAESIEIPKFAGSKNLRPADR